MSDWTQISTNRRRTGGFAGRSAREQDAYFEFFAGDVPGRPWITHMKRLIRRGLGSPWRATGAIASRYTMIQRQHGRST